MPYRGKSIPDEVAYRRIFQIQKQRFALEDLRVIFLQSIRNLNLLATFETRYIGLTSTVHSKSIFLKELKECSKRIYEIPNFIFYALGYVFGKCSVHESEWNKRFLAEKGKITAAKPV